MELGGDGVDPGIPTASSFIHATGIYLRLAPCPARNLAPFWFREFSEVGELGFSLPLKYLEAEKIFE